jgi:hypothetical protein
MIATDVIFQLATVIKADQGLAETLRQQLMSIYQSERYTAWRQGGLSEKSPFEIEDDSRTNVPGLSSLIVEGRLQVKLNHIHSRIFLTDGVWVHPSIRVFPFCDESETLFGYLRYQNLLSWAHWIFDLASGCGHNILAFDDTKQRIAFDINPRALAYLTLNQALNGLSHRKHITAMNDIRDGIPGALANAVNGPVLVVANMPFGIAPASADLPLTSNGGAMGMALQIATFKALQDFINLWRSNFPVRACLLAIAIGDRKHNRWEVVEEARRYFGQDRVQWALLKDEKIFRINGIREQDNPSPIVSALSRRVDCRLYFDDAEREAKKAEFSKHARRLTEQGYPDIAYGIIDINLQ